MNGKTGFHGGAAVERMAANETKCQQTILVNFTSANIIQMVINCNNNYNNSNNN